MAQPIARGVDHIFGTDLEHCSGCKESQEDLNAGMSFLEATIKRMKRKEKNESPT